MAWIDDDVMPLLESCTRWPAAHAGPVDRAALPGAAEHLGDRLLEALVGVGDAQPHALESEGAQAAKELPPERLGLGLAHVQADDLTTAAVVDP
jgi:hypothetical protein